MQYSHSRIETFNFCKNAYKMKYIDKVKIISFPNADNPLLIGTFLHEAIENGIDVAEKKYFSNFNILDDLQINESIKIRNQVPKILDILPKGGEFEHKLFNSDFVGYIDYLVETSPNIYDIYDFKYSNNTEKYLESRQLSLYKYYFEKINPGKKIDNLYFLMVPKIQIKQKNNEDIYNFRKRIIENIENPELIKLEYDPHKVIQFLEDIKKEKETTIYPKCNSPWCSYCNLEIKNYLGEEIMILPSVERRDLTTTNKKTLWIYGSPFSGKTTFANKFPNPLMLNTDGNIKFVDAPFISISNKVEMQGRIKNTQLAWDVFKDVIDELEKNQNEFKTIIIDLLEDLYEHCRLYIYKKLNIEHESDNSFKAWDIITTEFLSTMKRLMMLNYENIILISHEDTSKDITKRTGDKITSIRPNIREKVANKIAGMVDIVGRVVANGDERTLEFKQDEVVFGGGRLENIKNAIIPLEYDDFIEVYNGGEIKEETSKSRRKKKEVVEVEEVEEEIIEEEQEEKPKRSVRTRNKKVEEVVETVEDEVSEKNNIEDVVEVEEIKTRTRRRKREDN